MNEPNMPRRFDGGTPPAVDVLIIGGGSAAFAAALRARERGAAVTMVNAGTIGGTCVNVGCVPSKILIRAAGVRHLMQAHPFAGIGRCEAAVNRAALASQMAARVTELRRAKYQSILDRDPGIRFIDGRARFTDAHHVRVETGGGDTVTLHADAVLIATGASPAVPPVPGLEGTPYWTSTEALAAGHLPERMLVLGGSAVGLELAQAYHRLGTRVSVLELEPRLLPRMAPELGEGLAQALAAEGITVRTATAARAVRHDGAHFEVDTGEDTLVAEALLVAVGRRPNTGDLGLDEAGVETARGGAIIVDDHLRTSVPHIYAAGDCAALPQLVYVAAAAGTRAAENMTGGDATLDLDVLPAVVFTDPQVATVGLTDAEARERGIEVTTRLLPLTEVPRALANFDDRGFMQLVAESETGRVVGAHLLAAEAGEVVQTATLAVRHRMGVDDLAAELFPYLTMVEGLKLAAQTFRRDVSRLSCCAG